jgi:acyl-CoA reductase-like NAD-dependent aldehyde dehydrogenase
MLVSLLAVLISCQLSLLMHYSLQSSQSNIQSVKCGNHYTNLDVALSSLYTPSSAKRVLNLLTSAVAEGAELLTRDLTVDRPNRIILRPHILNNVTMKIEISNEETSSPIVCLC